MCLHRQVNRYKFCAVMLIFDAWLSLVEHCVRDAEVASSNLVASTSEKEWVVG